MSILLSLRRAGVKQLTVRKGILRVMPRLAELPLKLSSYIIAKRHEIVEALQNQADERQDEEMQPQETTPDDWVLELTKTSTLNLRKVGAIAWELSPELREMIQSHEKKAMNLGWSLLSFWNILYQGLSFGGGRDLKALAKIKRIERDYIVVEVDASKAEYFNPTTREDLRNIEFYYKHPLKNAC
jgi:hypothetical protein